ncbi:hypothetical protein BDN71DRAFT_1514803 [Pleurotus eryngii]|uniref:Uncharacterized protein n=1 Tax=Pleurotus eryngii TaxID=5323 RepID=A0A9P5ZIS3_PLEER|nr:hypothetical protein BDN71DRAFT_1514803 [Pleurotus eryngii]
MPTTSYPKYISQPPDDHPYWRNNHTKFERIRSIVKYDGSYDNHPLRTWSNACVELDDYYHIDWQEDGDTDLAQMVLDICEAARKGVLRPLYWEYIDGPSEYVLKARDAVNCVYANLRGHFEDLNSCSACTSNHAYEPLVSVTGNRILSYNIAIQPEDYGQIASFNYYVNHYRNPWISPNPVIAFNPWNVKITYLRRIRIDILQFFRQLIDYMFTTEFRDWVDSPRGAGDMRHYFYHHCPFYRFLDHHTPLMFQGFSRDCLHTEFNTQSWTRRSPTPPRNPLLTAEEDEYLHHIGSYLENQDHQRLANSLRHLREVSFFLSSHVRSLFNNGYLDPDYIFDGHNNRRAIVWSSEDDAAL